MTVTSVETRTQQLLAYVAVAGAVGWAGTYAVDEVGLFSFELDVYVVVAAWAVLVAAGALWARSTPAVRRARAWRVWVYVSAVALAVNAVANTPWLFPDPDLFVAVQDYAYYHPWFAAYAVGYAATARFEPRNRLVGRTERLVYAGAGGLSLAFLVALFALSIPDEYVVLAGGLLNVLPPLLGVGMRRRDGVNAAATEGRAGGSGTSEES